MLRYIFTSIISILISLLLSACSAAILSTGKLEKEIIHEGMTLSDVSEKLGEPLRIDTLSEPQHIWDLRSTEPGIKLFVHRDIEWQPPQDETVKKAFFIFTGHLRGDHDVGEAISVNLMTLGIAEPLMTANAIKEISTEPPHLLIVWVDIKSKILAYKWATHESLESVTK